MGGKMIGTILVQDGTLGVCDPVTAGKLIRLQTVLLQVTQPIPGVETQTQQPVERYQPVQAEQTTRQA